MYVWYSELNKGWKSDCRPMVGLDGCFLRTVCGGQLLSVVGRDGNNHMFPIYHSWIWLMEWMKDDLELGDGNGFTIISDQQKIYHISHLKLLM